MIKKNSCNRITLFKGLLVFGMLLFISCAQKVPDAFDKLNDLSDWNLEFSDPCTENWQDNWFLDGEIAKVEYNKY